MTQKNMDTGRLRKIIRQGPTTSSTGSHPKKHEDPRSSSTRSVCWEWQENDGSWVNYGELSDDIEEVYSSDPNDELSFEWRGCTYTILLKSMDQVNTVTNNVRKVRRKENRGEEEACRKEDDDSDEDSNDLYPDTWVLRGNDDIQTVVNFPVLKLGATAREYK